MNKLISICLLFCISSTVAFTLTSRTKFIDVVIDPDNVHVPTGFDSNDTSIQIMVTGFVPNTCFLRPRGEAKVLGKTITITMKATKVYGSDANCIQALVPYMATVSLNRLAEGNYRVVVNPGTSSEKVTDLNVEKPNSSSIDNFTYANITNVKESDDNSSIILEGAHPSSCMKFESIQVIPNGTQDTFAILPIIKQTAPICDFRIKPFAEAIPMPQTQSDVVVLHVRKIDGTAVNYRLQKNR